MLIALCGIAFGFYKLINCCSLFRARKSEPHHAAVASVVRQLFAGRKAPSYSTRFVLYLFELGLKRERGTKKVITQARSELSNLDIS